MSANFTFVRFLAGFGAPGGAHGRLSILMYHHVLAEPDPMRPLDITTRTFARQMSELAQVFNVLPLDEGMERLHAGTLPARSMCITFDDGYRDNVESALPVLRANRLPATFYVTSGVLGDGRMFNDTVLETLRRVPRGPLNLDWLGLGVLQIADFPSRVAAAGAIIERVKYLPPPERDAACQRLVDASGAGLLPESLMMTPEQVVELERSGMGVGGHTHTHATLTTVDDAEAWRQIQRNHADLSALLRSPPRSFAYPNGRPGRDFDQRHEQMVRRAGYQWAVSTAWGQVRRGDDPYSLARCGTFDVGAGRFAARLIRHGKASRGLPASRRPAAGPAQPTM